MNINFPSFVHPREDVSALLANVLTVWNVYRLSVSGFHAITPTADEQSRATERRWLAFRQW